MRFKKNILTSPNNPGIKKLISLRKPRQRRSQDCFIIEGQRETRLALASGGIDIAELYLCPSLLGNEAGTILKEAEDNGISRIFEVSPRIYERIAFGQRKEGVIALARPPKLSLDSLSLSGLPLLVILEAVEKPGNLGAVIRTAEAAGADAVIAASSATDIYNPNVVRASLGALFSLPVISAPTRQIISWLKSKDIRIICAVAGAAEVYTEVNFRQPCAIVLGSEEKGLSPLWKDSADYQAGIPMLGKTDSLNVSVSCGILLYEALRQRRA